VKRESNEGGQIPRAFFARSPGGSTLMFHYYLQEGDTAALSGLYARLCHAFLVFLFLNNIFMVDLGATSSPELLDGSFIPTFQRLVDIYVGLFLQKKLHCCAAISKRIGISKNQNTNGQLRSSPVASILYVGGTSYKWVGTGGESMQRGCIPLLLDRLLTVCHRICSEHF